MLITDIPYTAGWLKMSILQFTLLFGTYSALFYVILLLTFHYSVRDVHPSDSISIVVIFYYSSSWSPK